MMTAALARVETDPFAGLRGLKDGWDGRHTYAPSDKAYQIASEVVARAELSARAARYEIVADAAGGIAFYWGKDRLGVDNDGDMFLTLGGQVTEVTLGDLDSVFARVQRSR